MLSPFIIPDSCKALLRRKGLLLDSDFIISICNCDATELLRELKENGTHLYYLHPNLLELTATDRTAELTKRLKLVDEWLVQHYIIPDLFKNARRIQLSTPIDCQPSVADLYLGSVLIQYPNDNMFIISGNMKDYPSPLFERRDHIITQTSKESRVFTVISLNRDELIDITQ